MTLLAAALRAMCDACDVGSAVEHGGGPVVCPTQHRSPAQDTGSQLTLPHTGREIWREERQGRNYPSSVRLLMSRLILSELKIKQ